MFDSDQEGPTLFSEAERRLEDIVTRFEQAWHSEYAPEIESYLNGSGELRWDLLVQLVHTDLELRLKKGEAARVEDYLVQFPELSKCEDEELLLELAVAEFKFRSRIELDIHPDEYTTRFPQLGEEFAQRIKQISESSRARGLRFSQAADQQPPSLLHAELRQSTSGSVAAGPEHQIATRGFIQLGEYRLTEKLGQGGMGMVYKATHQRLGKTVAVKVISQRWTDDSEIVARFEREMKAVGRLNHPNLVQATDAGEFNGRHYLVMELVKGHAASVLVRQLGSLPLADACEIGRQVALALQHIHENDLVHRDIKPSNMIVTPHGVVKLLDLGLARLQAAADSTSDMTAAGQIMGTIDYMAPEQAGVQNHVDIRADIYALGSTLYKLLSGFAPFEDGRHVTFAQKASALILQSVPSIQLRCPRVPSGLVDILNRMLAKTPDDRYATPADVASALEPFTIGNQLGTLVDAASKGLAVESGQSKDQDGSTVKKISIAETHSYRASRREDSTSAVQQQVATSLRRPTWKRMLAVCALVFVVIVAALMVKISTDQGEVIIQSEDPELKITFWQNDKTVKEMELSKGENRVTLRVGQYEIRLAVPHDHVRIDKTKISLERAGTEVVNIVRTPTLLPPDVAVADSQPMLANYPILPDVLRWSIETVCPLSPSDFIFSPDGQQLAVQGTGRIHIWNLKTGALQQILLPPSSMLESSILSSPTWSAVGLISVLNFSTQEVYTWDSDTGLLQRTFSLVGLKNPAVGIARSPDGETMVVCSKYQAALINPKSGQILNDLPLEPPAAPEGTQARITWSHDGKYIAACIIARNYCKVHVLESESLRLAQSFTLTREFYGPPQWSHDDHYLVVSLRSAAVLHVRSGEITSRMENVTKSAAWLPGEDVLLVNGQKFDPSGHGIEEPVKANHDHEVAGNWLCSDDAAYYVGNDFSKIIVRERVTNQIILQIPLATQWQGFSAVSPDETLLYCNEAIWSLPHGIVQATVDPGNECTFSWFSPRNRYLSFSAGGSPIGSLRVIDLSQNKKVDSLPKFTGACVPAWMPDDSGLIGFLKNDLILHRMNQTGSSKFENPPEKLDQLMVSPDGTLLAGLNAGVSLSIWSIEDGALKHQLLSKDFPLSNRESIAAITWSPDSKQLAIVLNSTASEGASPLLLVLNAQTGEVTHRQTGPNGKMPDHIFDMYWDGKQIRRQIGLHAVAIHQIGSDAPMVIQEIPFEGILLSQGNLFLSRETTTKLWDVKQNKAGGKVVPLANRTMAVIGASGNWQGSVRAAEQLVYVVTTESGQELLTPEAFAKRFKWKNNPDHVQLLGE